MKILYVTQFFYPESIAASFRATDQARIWKKNGNAVTVFTAYPNYPTGKIFDGYSNSLFTEEFIDGIHVVRSKILVEKKFSFVGRILSMGSFLLYGLVNFLVHGNKIGRDFDVVLGTSGPVFAALLAWFYACFHHIPFVFELRDITYRQLIATGKSKANIFVKLMKMLELFMCRRAKHIVVLTEGFKQTLMTDGIDGGKITVITNGVEPAPAVNQSEGRRKLSLSYFGTLGISQKIEETFPYAAELAKIVDTFTYQIIGEGAQRESLEALLAEGEYPFIELRHGMPRDELEEYYRETDLAVVKLVKSEDFRYTLPSKLFQIMGHGIAVLYIGPDGEAADILRKYEAGIVLCGTPQEDIKTIHDFFDPPNWLERLQQMGQNGYKAVCSHYDRQTLAISYLDLLHSCAEHSTKGREKQWST